MIGENIQACISSRLGIIRGEIEAQIRQYCGYDAFAAYTYFIEAYTYFKPITHTNWDFVCGTR